MSNLNLAFVGLAVAVLPEMIGAIAETIEAVQVQFSDMSGEQKAKEVEEAVLKWYQASDKIFQFPPQVDEDVAKAIPPLVKLIYGGMKFTTEEQVLQIPDLPEESA